MITKKELSQKLYLKFQTEMKLEQIEKIVDSIFTLISEELVKKNQVNIESFGTFSLSEEVKKTLVKMKKNR